MRYNNPIIPGFHPDPSVCRVGSDYYLVTSSFEFFPGIPLFHSLDLIHWEQIGHVLTRQSQLDLTGCATSAGVWAPTIRYLQGRFYVVATDFTHQRNFLVWTDDIRGPWSEPVFLDIAGIDPSLFFEEDKVYCTCKWEKGTQQGIGQCALDLQTGRALTPPRLIWQGSGGKYPEGPHLYKREEWYYLMIAEGGTEYGHMETIARSRSPWGPYESCPQNPILTHRDTTLDHFQALGHGDLVTTPEGADWIVFHGIRPTQYMLHHLGRETMLAPVEWTKDGWPMVNENRLITPIMEVNANIPPRAIPSTQDHPFAKNGALHSYWVFLRNPVQANYDWATSEGALCLKPGNANLDGLASPTLLCRRQEHFRLEAQVTMDFFPRSENDYAGFTVFHTCEHHYDLCVTLRARQRVVILRKRVGDMLTESDAMALLEDGAVCFKIVATPLEYRFWASIGLEPMCLIGRGRTQLLSTECMPMTFTGCMLGLFAEGETKAWFSAFHTNEKHSCVQSGEEFSVRGKEPERGVAELR